MVLLKSVVEVATHPVPHMFTKLGTDGSGIGIMAVGGDPIRRDTSNRLGRSEECLGGCEVAVLAEHDVHQSAIAINRAIEISPLATHPDVRLVNIPTAAHSAFASPTQVLRQCRRQLGLPVAHGLVAEDEPAGQEHLGQIPQAQLVAQPPQHHEGDDIAWILRTVEHTDAALVELLAAIAAPEPAIALRRPLRPLADSRRSACRAPHPASIPSRGPQRARSTEWRKG